MLNINKINSNINFNSGMLYSRDDSISDSHFDKYSNYRKMNKSVYSDYVDGDISLIHLLTDKFEDLWYALTKKNPKLELKAQMIERNLLEEAQKKSHLDVAA